MLQAAQEANENQTKRAVEKAKEKLAESKREKNTILGLADTKSPEETCDRIMFL